MVGRKRWFHQNRVTAAERDAARGSDARTRT